MSQKRSDNATSADWGWATPDVLEQIKGITDYWANRSGSVDPGDLFQDLCLWLAVRPEKTRVPIEHLMQQVRLQTRKFVGDEVERAQREAVIYDAIYQEEL